MTAPTGLPAYADTLDPIERALADLAAGRPVVVVDAADRENEGDLILAASKATTEALAFMIRHTSGVVCVPMTGEALDRLELPPMTARNEDPKGTAYTVSVDARVGVTTGVSAADRARTIRALADPGTTPGDLTRPGHVFPLRAAEDGVLERAGHTEAAVDLARLAGLAPAGVIAEIVEDDGAMARLPRLREFAAEHGLAIVSIADLIAHRRRTEPPVRRIARTALPTAHGAFTAIGYQDERTGVEHVALVHGEIGGGRDVLVRLHSECLTGDVFGSQRCDCGAQLAAGMAAVVAAGRGVVVYLRGHEGRGIGLLPKLAAYALQDVGEDTVDANLLLGLPADARDYGVGAAILRDLGVTGVRLLTNNPAKQEALTRHGIEVTERVPVPPAVTAHNLAYLRTKRDRMGHDLPGLPDVPDPERSTP
jgi:3,4-dihydroxy 2-butanone 4-phosphate synthase/GTP cyclohydrolase II